MTSTHHTFKTKESGILGNSNESKNNSRVGKFLLIVFILLAVIGLYLLIQNPNPTKDNLQTNTWENQKIGSSNSENGGLSNTKKSKLAIEGVKEEGENIKVLVKNYVAGQSYTIEDCNGKKSPLTQPSFNFKLEKEGPCSFKLYINSANELTLIDRISFYVESAIGEVQE
jgi:hypothetical protein